MLFNKIILNMWVNRIYIIYLTNYISVNLLIELHIYVELIEF